ncbi:hypothetical protein GCM10008967_18440 [Bacillus carboniphilus]|uniref:Uncharacterized protein n=1 Tax=Bacillus carboniphilus TaxID=86663 RepID=A0ABP3FY66_9BACI
MPNEPAKRQCAPLESNNSNPYQITKKTPRTSIPGALRDLKSRSLIQIVAQAPNHPRRVLLYKLDNRPL